VQNLKRSLPKYRSPVSRSHFLVRGFNPRPGAGREAVRCRDFPVVLAIPLPSKQLHASVRIRTSLHTNKGHLSFPAQREGLTTFFVPEPFGLVKPLKNIFNAWNRVCGGHTRRPHVNIPFLT
jgi:hypothetical protein